MPRVVHFEVHADDPERASEFYSSVFGWKIKKWEFPNADTFEGEAPEYWLVMTEPETDNPDGSPGTNKSPGIDGGIMRRQGPAPEGKVPVSSYVCTIDVDSYDTYATKIEEAGGTNTVPKMAVEKVGWMGYFTDTEGNLFGIMENDESAS